MNAIRKHIGEVKSRGKKTLFKLKGITGKGTNGYRLAINSFGMKFGQCLIITTVISTSQILRGV